MQRIRIYENDNTNNRVVSGLSLGAILIPGFASAAADPIPVGTLVECSSISQFTANFGTEPPVFKAGSNIYPYSGTPDPKDIVSSLQARDKKYYTGSKAPVYDPTLVYSKDNQCIKDDTLYAAKVNIEAPEAFDPLKWNILLTNGDYIKVETDSEHGQQSSLYKYTIVDSVGSFVYEPADRAGFPRRAIPVTSDSEDPTNVQMFINNCDPSWTMAYRLISAGMPVVYVRMNNSTIVGDVNYDVTPARAYEFMAKTLFIADEYNSLLDKNINIQFLTSGGYPVLEHNYNIDQQMIAIATSRDTKTSPVTGFNGRGDCIAILDHTNNPYRELVGADSVFECGCVPESSYATVFTPWCKANITNLNEIPASFAYLYTLALKGSTCNTWSILAGVSKGRCSMVESLNTVETLTNKIAERYQNDYGLTTAEHSSINPITYIRNFGYCIWGDRTCERYISGNKGFALAFLHVRNLVSEVKKKVYLVSQELMFQTNDDVLWTKFKSKVAGLLDQMVAGNGLTSYTFTRDTNTGDATLLSATITLYPAYGLEKVEVTINLENDSDATIAEVQ